MQLKGSVSQNNWIVHSALFNNCVWSIVCTRMSKQTNTRTDRCTSRTRAHNYSSGANYFGDKESNMEKFLKSLHFHHFKHNLVHTLLLGPGINGSETSPREHIEPHKRFQNTPSCPNHVKTPPPNPAQRDKHGLQFLVFNLIRLGLHKPFWYVVSVLF